MAGQDGKRYFDPWNLFSLTSVHLGYIVDSNSTKVVEMVVAVEPLNVKSSGQRESVGAPLIWSLFAVLAIASAVPLLLTFMPPLNDYPNHLAQMHVLANLNRSETLQRFYRSVMDYQPNLAMDATVPILMKFMPIEWAGKLFIAATMLLTAAGTLALHFAIHRRWSFWPLLAFFFVYHRLFLWGLLNFSFGVGLMLCAVAAWVALREGTPALRIGASVLCSALVYLSHLYAFGIYALTIGGIELWYLFRRQPRRQLLSNIAVAGIQFLLPLYLFLFHGHARTVLTQTHWGTILRKLEAPFDVIYQYNLIFDVATLVLLLGLAAYGLLRRTVTFAWPLFPALAVLSTAFLLMPDELLSGYGADRRLPIAILLVGIAATDWRPIERRWQQTIVIGLVLLFAVRMALVANIWHRSDAVYADYVKAVDMLPVGARVLFYALHRESQSLQPIPYLEIADLAVVRRDAFMPSLFTSPPLGSESIAFAPDVEKIALDAPVHIQLAQRFPDLADERFAATRGLFRQSVLANFDYVFVIHPETLPPASAIPPSLKLAYRGREFVLLKIGS